MPKVVVGYGEDALTYWALTSRAEEFLHELRDSSNPRDCVLFYRPSFGRRSDRGNAQFGEFDAIFASKTTVYLTESKWGRSPEVKPDRVVVTPTQRRRHKMMRWYIDHWKPGITWKEFATVSIDDEELKGRRIPRDKTILAKNLEFVLSTIHEHIEDSSPMKVLDVLLLLTEDLEYSKRIVEPQGFKLVVLTYGGYGGTSFFDMEQIA